MDVKEAVNKVLNSDIFKNWDKKDNYLVSCVFIDDHWNVDFYSKKSKRVTSFAAGNKIKISKEDKVFQDEIKDLEELKLNSVKVSLDEADEIVNLRMKEMAGAEDVSKAIIILQQLKVPMWNLSYITSAFNVMNVKINAINKKIIEESFSPVFSFRKDVDQP